MWTGWKRVAAWGDGGGAAGLAVDRLEAGLRVAAWRRGAGGGKVWGLGYRRGKVMITHLASGGTAGTAVAAVTSGATAAAGDEGHVGDAEVTRWGGGTAKGLEGEGG